MENRLKNKLIMYMHAGSGNHGCEAIVNSVCHMVKENTVLVSYRGEEDEVYSLQSLCEILQERSFPKNKAARAVSYFYRRLTGDEESLIRYRYREVFKEKAAPLAISIGGDNYCYDNMLRDLRLTNAAFNRRGSKTVLLGCSIEPELLKRQEIMEDLSGYHAIIARESITCEALKEAFKKFHEEYKDKKIPKLYCYPDPAFILGKKELPLPAGFATRNTVGINVSPMVQSNESRSGITMKSYQSLIEFIIDHTDMQIALIPHVVWKNNDDRIPLHELYERYAGTGRVLEIGDGTCEELKGYISRCRLFIGARTHATIAAYSSCVPTLVVGYSVKAKGIAMDLFGTDDHYVIPVQSLKEAGDLTNAFKWLMEQEDEIRARLKRIMPEYKERALLTGKEVDRLWEELSRPQEI